MVLVILLISLLFSKEKIIKINRENYLSRLKKSNLFAIKEKKIFQEFNEQKFLYLYILSLP